MEYFRFNMESIPPQVNTLLGAFSPILFVAQYVFNATGINLGHFETQLLSLVVVIAGLTYGYPICRDFVDKWMMSHVTLEGSDMCYGYAAMFIRDKFGEKGRDLTVMSVRMNEDNHAMPNKDGFADLTKFQYMRRYMPGFGTHWFRYQGHWVSFTRSFREPTDMGRTTRDDPFNETIRFSCFGSSPKLLKKMLEEAEDDYESRVNRGMVSIFRPTEKCSHWGHLMTTRARRIETVAMDEVVRTRIRDDMNRFLLNRAWYTYRTIPYRRGYMLEGPPGTGKSSLVQALTGLFGLSTYLIPLLSKDLTEDNLASLFAMLPARCVVLFEDIDTAGIVVRALNDGKLECATEDYKDDKRGGVRCNISLAGLLNIIDGVGASEGRILIMTTNRIEKLDKALLRPGRIDFTVQFALATDEVAKTLFERLYEDCPGMTEELAAAFGRKFGGGKHSPAMIQSFVMEYPHQPQEALKLADRWIEENVAAEKEAPSAEEKMTYVKVEKKETK
ncbi:hypothetical protein LTR47_009987 [Exophiala xenobiotica]|nr:hypothetical protein LTR47_009987 [Exophiala xenobiotica]KAK5245580.1 hypothetical protein LTS06_008998 [Exophiala xenobiotica]KAK5322705.1 hypothetical protein LTR93_005909 [Exophiala xenobiotica]KAK5373065.1 hypothetical protein LTR11_005804 [Exophiala xenobiotica]KAK5376477.1 hypothetical protein LTS03_005245 [Exophiala xenobiotica]